MSARTRWLADVIVVSAVLAAPGAIHANCGSSQRVSHSDAACLAAGWTNETAGCEGSLCASWWTIKTTSFWAENECSERGTVVARIDLESVADRAWSLDDASRRTGQASDHVSDIYCCTDLSTAGLCD